jgi:hypothetical protein
MNSSSYERLIEAIDKSIDQGNKSDRDFVEKYIQLHRAEIIDEIREKGCATIPTSTGREIKIMAGEGVAA